jgi:hypothetical protein
MPLLSLSTLLPHIELSQSDVEPQARLRQASTKRPCRSRARQPRGDRDSLNGESDWATCPETECSLSQMVIAISDSACAVLCGLTKQGSVTIETMAAEFNAASTTFDNGLITYK